MEQLLERELTLNLNFEKRKVVLNFLEPSIYNLLKFNKYIQQEKYLEWIKFIIPNINEKDFLSNPVWIINWIKTLIYWEQKEKTWNSIEEDSDWFFPSALDLVWNRYWILPTELIKLLSFTQLMICIKWYEWNLNIQNWKEKDNMKILLEIDWNNEQIEKDREKAQKDKEFFKKYGKNIENL